MIRTLTGRWLIQQCYRCSHPPCYRRLPIRTPSMRQLFHHQGRSCSEATSSTASTSAVPNTEISIWDYPSVIDVSPLAESLRQRVREFTSSQKERLKLVGILANQGPHRHDAEVYAENIQESCHQDGIQFELWRTTEHNSDGGPSPESIRRIQELITKANERPDVDGLLVFYPIYQQHLVKGPYKDEVTGVYFKTHDDYFRDLVLSNKDVEGLCRTKWLRLPDSTPISSNSLQLYPCTALSVLWSIEAFHIPRTLSSTTTGIDEASVEALSRYSELHVPSGKWKNLTVSVINRSEIMGRPLAVMLARKGATVYSIDIDSILQFQPNGRMHRCNTADITLQNCLTDSNVVVTGVPDPDFQLPLNFIQRGSTIISVSEYPNVCEETLLSQRPDILYIPQVGKVTVAVLENNLVHLKKLNLDQPLH